MQHVLVSGFLYKAARRREIEEIAKGNLSEASIARIVENSRGMKNERFIKPIGSGAMNQADLVLHPKHGIVVRKNVNYRTDVKALAAHPEIELLRKIKNYQDKHGPSGFGRIHEVSQGSSLVFQEYVKGSPLMDASGKRRTFEFLKKTARPPRSFMTAPDNAVWNVDKARRAEGLMMRLARKAQSTVPESSLTTQQRGLVKHLRRSYPFLHDHNRFPNVLKTRNGSKVMIDAATGRGFPAQGFMRGANDPRKFEQFRVRNQIEEAMSGKGVNTKRFGFSKKPYLIGLAGLGAAGLGAAAYSHYRRRDAA